MGIGLSISRSIVGQLGGKLWAESQTDPGATFLFTLPVLREEKHKEVSVSA
jgi:signal transduction histidine kinase